MVGQDNTILYNFLRVFTATLLVGLVLLGVSWFRPSSPPVRPEATAAAVSRGESAITATKHAALSKEIAVDLGNGVKLEMVPIPAGEFMMGSPDADKDAGDNEKPQHRIRISRPFYLAKYPATQEQWEAVMGRNPSRFKGPKNPVESVSWDDCQKFLEKLNAKSGPGGGKFQLPTEAQWEYACRAGSTTRYCFGDDESHLGEYAWYDANSGGKPHPVGQKKPNAWELYDMHGSVWEWCADWYDRNYYKESPRDDPTGPTTGSSRVIRGCTPDSGARYCRSAFRRSYPPRSRLMILGLRVSRIPAEGFAENPAPDFMPPLKIQPVPTQTVEVGKPLTVAVSVEDAKR